MGCWQWAWPPCNNLLVRICSSLWCFRSGIPAFEDPSPVYCTLVYSWLGKWTAFFFFFKASSSGSEPQQLQWSCLGVREWEGIFGNEVHTPLFHLYFSQRRSNSVTFWARKQSLAWVKDLACTHVCTCIQVWKRFYGHWDAMQPRVEDHMACWCQSWVWITAYHLCFLDSSQWDCGSRPRIYNTSGGIREDLGHPHCELFLPPAPPRFQIYLFIHFIPLFIHLLLGAQINFLANPVFFNLKSYVSFCCCFFIGGYLIYNVELVSDVQQGDLVIHIAILFRYFSYIGYYGVSSLSCTVYPCRLTVWYITVQFSSVTQSCPTLCDPINCSMPGLPVHHQLPEFTQTHIHWVGDAIQPSHPLSFPSPPAPNPSQHQSLFQWVNSSHEVAKVLEFQLQHQSLQRNPRADLQNGLVGSPWSPRDSQVQIWSILIVGVYK